MSDGFTHALKHFCERLRAVIEGGNEVAIISHLDADGITSGSIIAMALGGLAHATLSGRFLV